VKREREGEADESERGVEMMKRDDEEGQRRDGSRALHFILLAGWHGMIRISFFSLKEGRKI